MLHRSWHGFTLSYSFPLDRKTALERTEPVRSRIIKIANQTHSNIIDPFNFLCDEKICPVFSSEGDLLYKDYDHLSLYTVLNKVHYFDFIKK